MQILSTSGWKEYELLDSGHGMRYERFGPYTTVRPDPQAIWLPTKPQEWHKADVQYVRTVKDQGQWKFKRAIPEKWKMTWKNLSFWAKLTSFKHTGVFPEQSLQWNFMQSVIANAVKQSNTNVIPAKAGISVDGSRIKSGMTNKGRCRPGETYSAASLRNPVSRSCGKAS